MTIYRALSLWALVMAFNLFQKMRPGSCSDHAARIVASRLCVELPGCGLRRSYN